MPKKGHIPKREAMRDPKSDNVVITKLTNNAMLDGKKGAAQRIVYKTLENVEETTDEEALEVFYKALNSIMPVLEVKGYRIGGATYQVPVEVRLERRQTLGLRWLILFVRKRGEKTTAKRLAKEILDASNGLGASVKRKEEMYRTAEANKAFAHYGW